MTEKFQKLLKNKKKKLTREQLYEEILKDDTMETGSKNQIKTNFNSKSQNASKMNGEETREEQPNEKRVFEPKKENNNYHTSSEKKEEAKPQSKLTKEQVNEKVNARKGELENSVKDFIIKAKDNEKKLKEESDSYPGNKEKQLAWKDEENKNRQKMKQMEKNSKSELEQYEAKLIKDNNLQ